MDFINEKTRINKELKATAEEFKKISNKNIKYVNNAMNLQKLISDQDKQIKENKYIDFHKYLTNKKKLGLYKREINNFKYEQELNELEIKELKTRRNKLNKLLKHKKIDEISETISHKNILHKNYLYHLIQLKKIQKKYDKNYIYTHEVKYYNKKGKLVNASQIRVYKRNKYYQIIEDIIKKYDGEHIYIKIPSNKKYFILKKAKYSKDIFSINHDNTYPSSDLLWLPAVWVSNNKGNTVEITSKKIKQIIIKPNNNIKEQKFRNDVKHICFYTGMIKFLEKKIIDKNNHAKAIYNKIYNNSEYQKEYSLEDIQKFCDDFKLSVKITNLYNRNDDINISNSGKSNMTIEFINTKYNHVDQTFNNYEVESINKDEYDDKKLTEPFYIEKYGTLTTINKVYKKEDTEFKLIFDKWKSDNKLDKNFIVENNDSQITDMLSKYDFNMHTFFKQFDSMHDDESNYMEYDIEKAYFNYCNKDKNEFYLGVPSGSFISTSCDETFNNDTFLEQVNNKLVGFYNIKITGYKQDKDWAKLGFLINSEHVLFSSMVKLLIPFLEFKYLNCSYAPSIHIPFSDEFLKCEESKNILGKPYKGLKHYCKAVGLLLRSPDSYIQTEIKPLDNDKDYYKLINDKRFNCYYDDKRGVYYINDSDMVKKSYRHIGFSIHSYTSTIILNELLNMDFNKVLGVKFDSIIVNKSYYNYEAKSILLKQKNCKINLMFQNLFNDDLLYKPDTYKHDISNDKYILDFKSFKINGKYITKSRIYLTGAGGTGKTFNVLENFKQSNLLHNVAFSSLSWDLIQQKTDEYKGIIGLSIPKLTGFNGSQKCEKTNNNNIKYIVRDEMTLSNKSDELIINNDYNFGYIFYLGDIDIKGVLYQCSINKKNVYKPDIINHQIINFTKSYRFDDELNERLHNLRNIMISNNNNIFSLKKEFKVLFKDRIFKANEINFNDNDIGISPKNDFKADNRLTDFFIKKGTKPQYYIKTTNLFKNELRGQKVNEPSNNTETKLFKTIHSFQGRQLDLNDNKIIIYINNIFDYELLYTAVSRARRTNQIFLFENIN